MINHLQSIFKDDNTAITFIYCNFGERNVQTVQNLVASLLKQIVQDRGVISDVVKSLYKDHRNTPPTLDEYTKALQSEIKMFSRVFVVVDALDECLDNNRFLLLNALRSLWSNVNLMITSRDLLSIAQLLPGTRRMDIRATDSDVRRYVEGRIARAPRRHLKALREIIVDKVAENVKGM